MTDGRERRGSDGAHCGFGIVTFDKSYIMYYYVHVLVEVVYHLFNVDMYVNTINRKYLIIGTWKLRTRELDSQEGRR